MTRKVKITFSLSQKVTKALKAQSPGGNSSAYVEKMLLKNLDFQSLGGDNMKGLIQHYATAKADRKDDRFQIGWQHGIEMAEQKCFSLDAFERLEQNLEPNMLSWHDTDNNELSECVDEAIKRSDIESDDFRDGFFRGALSVWKQIKPHI